MKNNLKILLGILLVLGIAAVLVLQKEGEQSVEESAGEPLFRYDSTAVDKLEILDGNTTVVLEKKAGAWIVTSPVNYPAEETAVASAVGKGNDMRITALVSTNPAKQSVYAVDSASTLVRVFANNNPVAAFRVGKSAGTWTETYARKEGADEVYSVTGTLKQVFVRQPGEWRNKTIFKIDQPAITEITFRYPGKRGSDTTFALTRRDSVTWAIGADSIGNSAVVNMLNYLANFQADEFVDEGTSPATDLAAVIGVNGTQLRFYRRADNKYNVQTSASPQWFTVSEWKANQVLKRKKDFAGI